MSRRILLTTLPAVLLACTGESAPTIAQSDAVAGDGTRYSAAAPPVANPAPMADQAMTQSVAASKQSAEALASAPASPEATESGESQTLSQGAGDLLAQSMIIRTGTASIKVDSLAEGMARVRALARRVGGYVGNTAVQSEGGAAPSATLELRVPSARFEEAIAGVESLGTTENIHVSAEDVGEQYVDLDSRLSNSRRLEARLIELLATRTGRLSDVVQVEEKLSRVRGEIERIEGRMRWLRSHASVSTISVTVHEPYPVVGPTGTPRELAEAFRRAWRNFVALIAGLIAASGVLVPVAAVVGAAWVIWRRRSRGEPPVPQPSPV